MNASTQLMLDTLNKNWSTWKICLDGSYIFPSDWWCACTYKQYTGICTCTLPDKMACFNIDLYESIWDSLHYYSWKSKNIEVGPFNLWQHPMRFWSMRSRSRMDLGFYVRIGSLVSRELWYGNEIGVIIFYQALSKLKQFTKLFGGGRDRNG